MSYSAVTIVTKGPCPCCGSEMKDISFVYGERYLTIFHEQDDMSKFSIEQLINMKLCGIDQATGEKFKRDYIFPE